jgi:hypothetical protein
MFHIIILNIFQTTLGTDDEADNREDEACNKPSTSSAQGNPPAKKSKTGKGKSSSKQVHTPQASTSAEGGHACQAKSKDEEDMDFLKQVRF